MLKLSESQLAQLDQLEKLQYLGVVRNHIVAEYPELAKEGTLADRLKQAYIHAVGIGIAEGPTITQFLYYEAFAPNFYRQPAINAWLTKPGRSVEQRFGDMIAQLKSKLRDF